MLVEYSFERWHRSRRTFWIYVQNTTSSSSVLKLVTDLFFWCLLLCLPSSCCRVLKDCISLLPSFQPELIHGQFLFTARFYPILHVLFPMPTLSCGLNNFFLPHVFTTGYVSSLGLLEVLDYRAHNPHNMACCRTCMICVPLPSDKNFIILVHISQ